MPDKRINDKREEAKRFGALQSFTDDFLRVLQQATEDRLFWLESNVERDEPAWSCEHASLMQEWQAIENEWERRGQTGYKTFEEARP